MRPSAFPNSELEYVVARLKPCPDTKQKCSGEINNERGPDDPAPLVVFEALVATAPQTLRDR